MKKFTLPLILVMICSLGYSQLGDTKWVLAPVANCLAVGSSQGASDWWALDMAGVSTRACLMDDTVYFDADGDFSQEMGGSTWLEVWQGAAAEGCGAPIAPHDGATPGTWSLDGTDLVISGTGSFLGLSKVYNGGELTAPGSVSEITYTVEFNADEDTMIVDIAIASPGWWRFIYTKIETGDGTSVKDVTVNNKMVYPSVVTDYITIDAAAAQYEVINTLGQTVIVSKENRINLSSLPAGMYFVKANDQMARILKK